VVVPSPPRSALGRIGIPIGIAVIAAAAGGMSVWMARPNPPSPAVTRLEVMLPEGDQFSAVGRTFIALSPDGTRLVYVANQQLFVRALDQLSAVPIAGTTNATSPFFSPDGQWIGFWQAASLKKVPLAGGPVQTLCEAQNPYGVSWSADGTILFGQATQGILRVPDSGGTPEIVIKTEENQRAFGPQLLPDGRSVLFTMAVAIDRGELAAGSPWDEAEIVVQPLGNGTRKVITRGGSVARYLSTGHLVFVRNSTLLAVPFDPVQGTVVGSPVPVIQQVRQGVAGGVGGIQAGGVVGGTGAAQFAVSETGALAYVSSGPDGSVAATLVWVDREGRETPLGVPERLYGYPRLSPDGRRVAVDIRDQEYDIWIWDVERRTLARLTFDPAVDLAPVWTHDARRLIWFRNGDGLHWQAADGTGTPERLTTSAINLQAPSGMLHGGTSVLLNDVTTDSPDIRALDLVGGDLTTILGDPKVSETEALVSPDGRWIAYQSNESGRSEIYVRTFPDVQGGRWQVSRDGGTRPLWSRDGRELFFMATVGPSLASLMVVSVETTPTFLAGEPRRLPGGPFATSYSGRTYDVSPDGQRFLVVKRTGAAAPPPTRIVIVSHWFDELRRLVPTR
jgi:serine/threonine-protein kinase